MSPEDEIVVGGHPRHEIAALEAEIARLKAAVSVLEGERDRLCADKKSLQKQLAALEEVLLGR